MKDKIKQLISGPASNDRPFIYNGASQAEIRIQSRQVQTMLAQSSGHAPVCLCTENYGHLTAALLSALSGDVPLILPYAFSKQALIETYQALAYHRALTDASLSIPQGVSALDLNQLPETAPASADRNALGPDDLWVYLFTGGSTGKPKTWTKSVRNLLSEAYNIVETFNITADDIILATVPPHHIYGLLYAVLAPLVSGALVVAETPTYPNEIVQALERTQATVLVSIPPHYRALKTHSFSKHHLKRAFSSAGALAPEDDLAFYEATGVAVTEVYGSTETGGIAYRQRALGQSELRPFECVDWKIDHDMLCVKSLFLSSELRRDEEGYFQTADRVEVNQNQEFKLLGRADGIIKVAGKRVDLTAVAQTLKQLPGVQDAYVFSRPVEKGRENEILALIEGDVPIDKLHEQLKSRLEPYALPRKIRVVGKIPISKVGKYDRVAIEKIFS